MDETSSDPLPALEREITSLAGQLAAGTCRFLELVAAFDTGGGWRGQGLRSCAQWLSWKCGLSTAAAHEQLRVARALTGLPSVREAFSAGRISYSKARALTRVATVDDESTLVAVATGCTAAQLDRLCAGLARARSAREVAAQAAGARFVAHWQPDGTLRFSGRLPPEGGAVLLAALSAVGSGPEAAHTPTPTADACRGGAARAATGAGTAGERAARDDASALVELARHALSSPAPVVGADPVRLMVHTTEQVLAELPHDGAAAARSREPSAGVWTADDGDTEIGTVGLLDAGPGIPPVPLSPATMRRLLCEAIVEAAIGRPATRYATRRQRRALLARDHGCGFPGCPRRRGLHAHHVRHWADGGPTVVSNMLLLCERHHLSVHEGGWQLARTATGWTAVDPSGRPHVAAPPLAGNVGCLRERFASVAPAAITGRWSGEHLDLDYAVGVLAAIADPSRPAEKPCGRELSATDSQAEAGTASARPSTPRSAETAAA